jgi:two-component system, LytTR family, response regulator
VRLLIVERQGDARDDLSRYCKGREDVIVVGETDCGKAAIEAAARLNPDILLVDAELPDMSGFELLRTVEAGADPLAIMMSSCADHENRAFAAGVLDYLVMPVTQERFDQAMVRARHRIHSASPGYAPLASSSAELTPMALLHPRFLVGERQHKLYPLNPMSIDYIEADGNYVTLRSGRVEYLSRDSVKRLSVQLAGAGFIRIARSLLVNAAMVSYAEVAGHGTYALTLTSGVCLHSTAAYRDELLRMIPLPPLSKRFGNA